MSNEKALTLPPRYAFSVTSFLIIFIGFNHIEYMPCGSPLPYQPQLVLIPYFIEYLAIVLKINQLL